MGGRGHNEKEGRERPRSDYTRYLDPQKAQKWDICFNIQDTNIR